MTLPVLIIGGGIAGLTTAVALQHFKIDFRVLEAVPEIKGVGAGISLAGNAMRVMQQLGLAETIKAEGHPISAMVIQDENGKTISVMDAGKLSREHGLDNVAIHRGALHQILVQALPLEKILTQHKAIDIQEYPTHVEIVLQNGNRVSGACALVADGIHSVIRKKLLPLAQIRYSGYTCWRGIVTNTWGIENAAYETWGPAGRFGYVPVGGNKIYWFACKNAPAKSEAMQRMTIKQLAENFSKYFHPIPEIISQTPASELIWSDIIDLKPISKYAFGKAVLLGDAAHATTPNMGQGACMGIEDAWLIARLLHQHTQTEAAFKLFETQRLARTHYIVNTSYRLGKVAQWENQLLAKLRNGALRLMPASVNEKQVVKLLDIEVG
jgi:2-polyprenyl-6-methoxyphenol hydroxylase-like FAD-dependent oxidoreductase